MSEIEAHEGGSGLTAKPVAGVAVFRKMILCADGVAEYEETYFVQLFGTNEEFSWDF